MAMTLTVHSTLDLARQLAEQIQSCPDEEYDSQEQHDKANLLFSIAEANLTEAQLDELEEDCDKGTAAEIAAHTLRAIEVALNEDEDDFHIRTRG